MEKLISFFAFYGVSCLFYLLFKLLSVYTPEKAAHPVLYRICFILTYISLVFGLLAVFTLGILDNHLLQRQYRHHLSDLKKVRYLASLHNFPPDAMCDHWELSKPTSYDRENGLFSDWRSAEYEKLGI